MKLSIPMSITLSLSGQPFNGPDIGGFSGNPSPDLFANWIALGAFYPFSRGHACQGTINKEPWAFGPEVEQAARTALNRRYMLLPYLYTLFYDASQTNMPIMQPVFFANPKDKTLRYEEQAFLLGQNLLVVPQWAKNPDLPSNFTQQLLLENETPQMRWQPTMYQRKGSVIPVGKLIQSTAQFSTDSLTLYISLDENGKASGTLYTDDGEGFEYQSGQYELKSFDIQKDGNTLTVKTTHLSGNQNTSHRSIRCALLTNEGTIISKWLSIDNVKKVILQ